MRKNFDKQKQDALQAAKENDIARAARHSPEEQLRIKQERVRQMGELAFAHRYGPYPLLDDEDRYPEP